MELYFPTELPEQLAYAAAALLALIGLFQLLLPASAMKFAGLTVGDITPEGYAATRSGGGLQLGLGLSAILLAQDWTYMALGGSVAAAVLGRLLSIVFDRGLTVRNFVFLIVQIAIAVLPLAYVLGYFQT